MQSKLEVSELVVLRDIVTCNAVMCNASWHVTPDIPLHRGEEDSALTENKDSKESFNIHSRNWTFFEDLDFPSK